jgi:membrane associated rhomboid family serine protease
MLRSVQLAIGRDRPRLTAPLAVAAIGLVDLALCAALAALPPADSAAVVDRFGLVPRDLLRALAHPGPGSARAWLTPLSSMFLHAGPLHLAGNLVYLWIFGADLEARLGHWRFLLFYLACGLAAAALHVASAPSSWLPTVGASGAISGLLGAYAARDPTRRVRLYWPRGEVPALAFLLLWVALQLAAGIDAWGRGGAVAGFAHLGGFAAGAVLARGVVPQRPARARLRS